MATARCFSFGKEVQLDDKSLPEKVFAAEVNQGLIYESVKSQLGNRRQGTASSKTRGEVRGTTKKPWTQKKTGRARAGSAKSPLWRGGGITFGPRPRDYTTLMPKKMRRAAIVSLLSHLASEGRVSIIQDIDLKEYKTTKVKSVLLLIAAGLFETPQLFQKSNHVQKKTVLVLSSKGALTDYYPYLRKSAQNLAWVTPVNVDSLEMKDIFYARSLVFTDAALAELTPRLSASVERGSTEKVAQKLEVKVEQGAGA